MKKYAPFTTALLVVEVLWVGSLCGPLAYIVITIGLIGIWMDGWVENNTHHRWRSHLSGDGDHRSTSPVDFPGIGRDIRLHRFYIDLSLGR